MVLKYSKNKVLRLLVSLTTEMRDSGWLIGRVWSWYQICFSLNTVYVQKRSVSSFTNTWLSVCIMRQSVFFPAETWTCLMQRNSTKSLLPSDVATRDYCSASHSVGACVEEGGLLGDLLCSTRAHVSWDQWALMWGVSVVWRTEENGV